jgi:hypothetical protein
MNQLAYHTNNVLSLVDLSPSLKTDKIFSELVAFCLQNKHNSVSEDIAKPIRERAMKAESELEKYWNKRILSSTNPQLELTLFPYYLNYKFVAEKEVKAMIEQGILPGSDIVFMGSGALPLSAYWYILFGYKITVVDSDFVSLNLGIELLTHLNSSVQSIHSLAQEVDLFAFNAIIISATIDWIPLKTSLKVFYRDVSGHCTLLYPPKIVTPTKQYLADNTHINDFAFL